MPFTFPGAPEPWRQAGLAGLDRAKSAVGRYRSKGGSPVSGAWAAGPYDESALRIGQNLRPSVTLVAVARGTHIVSTDTAAPARAAPKYPPHR